MYTLIRVTTEVLYALPHLLDMITFNRSGGILNYTVAVMSQHWNWPVCHWITVCLSSILLRFSGRKFVILRLIEHKLFRNIVFDQSDKLNQYIFFLSIVLLFLIFIPTEMKSPKFFVKGIP